jgi:hypothetical protein
MSSNPTLLTRTQFRESVFERDNHTCVFCDNRAADAHHIVERRLFPDQGYYIDNGASVCEHHHKLCEQTVISTEQVREACGIKRVVLPPHLYPDHVYDKWGNPILEDGRRAVGELFFDESVQKILGQGGVLELFTPYVKYERTFHLPWSPGMHDNDKALKDASLFHGKRIVVSVKMDGENTTAYSDGHIHARSIDSRGGEDRAWVKKFLTENVCFNLPAGWRICGENVWAEHSIHYDNLPSYFMGFSLWTDKNVCLSWDETLEYFELLGVTHVPVIYDGLFEQCNFPQIEKSMDFSSNEGYVVRLAESFKYGDFRKSVAKFVRPNHVQTTKHWRAGRRFTKNELIID